MSQVVLITGSDPVLVGEAAVATVARFAGADLEEFRGVGEYTLDAAVMAAATPSMFGDRVVVLRDAGQFGKDDLAPLLAYLENPAPDATMVIVWESVTPGTRQGDKVRKAVQALGGEIQTCGAPAQARAREEWLREQLADAPVSLTNDAAKVLIDRLGEDAGRIGGVLRVLEATYGARARVSLEQLDPYLPGAGGVPPWDLTDAIDEGDVSTAVTRLRRMLDGGGRHPLQIMVTLTGHYEKMLRLDGTGVRGDAEAAALLGIKGSTFPAKKALRGAQRLGSAGLGEAFTLLAAADVELRGATALPAETVMEVLVARLANLSRRAGGGAAGGRGGPSSGGSGGRTATRRRP